MYKASTVVFLNLLVLANLPLCEAQTVVSEFSGSSLLGEYASDFDAVSVLQRDTGGALAPVLVEGQLSSRLYALPETKSVTEFKHSYEQTLAANGFDIVTTLQNATGLDINAIRTANRSNRISKRKYEPQISATTAARVETQVDYYLYAQRSEENQIRYLIVLMNEAQGFYAIDEVTTAAMQTDSVKVTEEALGNALASEGKIAIYDIYFSTGSAELDPASNDAMDVIGSFLNNNPEISVYVVGHTDDTGDYDHNMNLSRERAKSVVDYLIGQSSVGAARLKASGVGPLAPAANNVSDTGKQRNRRVELVRRLK